MTAEAEPRPLAARYTFAVFATVLILHFAGATTGWRHGMLPGHTFRQAQTALSTFFIQQEGRYTLAYPTPVLGKPWSIPMEFPLYEWAVCRLNNLTGGPLVESARTVSLLCFYLTLPAFWLLLRELAIDPGRRWLVLAFVPACPVFVFYARAFLIESMALLFAVWFLAALFIGLKRGALGWLLGAVIAGCGAGLVKVTTLLLFLIPVGIALAWQFRLALAGPADLRPPVRRRLGLAAVTLAFPLAASAAWILYADSVKAVNPAADMLRSGPQRAYNFGQLADRFSSDYWIRWTDLSTRAVFHPGVVVAVIVLALFGPRRWRPFIGGGLALFALAPLIFPFLYAWHDYYYFANASFLAVAGGFAAVALLDSRVPRWLGGLLVLGALLLQGWQYSIHYLPEQRLESNGASALSRLLFDLTDKNDVLVVAGQDWNSMLPWSAQRRALMIRRGFEDNPAYLARAFADLQGEFPAVLVLTGHTRNHAPLLGLAESRLNIHPEPFLETSDSVVYVNQASRAEWTGRARTFAYEGVRVLRPDESAPPILAGEVKHLHSKSAFGSMQPSPVRFEVPYGLASIWPGSRALFNAHAPTHLWFEPAAGRRHVEIEFGILDSAWSGKEKSDGVEFALILHTADGGNRKLWNRFLNPDAVPADRGLQVAEFTFDQPAGSRLQLSTLPGPSGANSFDWAYIASFRLK